MYRYLHLYLYLYLFNQLNDLSLYLCSDRGPEVGVVCTGSQVKWDTCFFLTQYSLAMQLLLYVHFFKLYFSSLSLSFSLSLGALDNQILK